MLARTATKLLDEAILPAVIIIAAKIIGLVLANSLNSLQYSLQPGGTILPWTIAYSSAAEAQTANTFSNLVMYLVILAGFSVVLFRAHYLHASHVHPMVVAKLTRLKMENLIATTFEIYHQALVWLAFLWITTVVIFIYTLGGGSLTLGLIAFLLSFAATYLYEKDLEIELEVEKLLAKGT